MDRRLFPTSHAPNDAQKEVRFALQRTLDQASALNRAADTLRDYSLTALILSRCPDTQIVDRRGLEAAHELSSQALRSYGGAGLGDWVPFTALRDVRDLTLANSGSLYAQQVHPVLGPGSIPARSILGAGATIITGLQSGSTLSIPYVSTQPDTTTTGVWGADGSSVVQREPVFGQRLLYQKTAAFEIRVSRRLLLQSSLDVERDMRKLVSSALFNCLDAAIVNGDGIDQPLGLLADPALQVVAAGTNGAAPTWAHMVQLEHETSLRVGSMQMPRWVMHPNLRKKLRTTARGTNLDYIMADGDSMLGHAANISTAVPAALTKGTGTGLTALLFGDLAEIYVGFWGPAAVDLLVDGVTMRKDGKIRIIGRVDVGVVARNIDAFGAFKDLNPA